MWTNFSTSQQEQMLRIIARASPPHERSAGAFFLPVKGQDQARIERQTRLWRKGVADDAPGRFDTYLRTQGLSEEGFQDQMAEVAVRDRDALPEWAEALVALLGTLAAQPASGPETPQSPAGGVAFEIVVPLLRAAKDTLERDCIAPARIAVSESAREGMLGVLRNRFWQLLESLLAYELQLAATSAGLLKRSAGPSQTSLDPGVEAWLERFERFPAVAYLIGVAYRNWRVFMTEICERLASDRELLSDALFKGARLGSLVGFWGDAGDVHGHGRAVVIMEFEQGYKVAYKPKDLRCALAFVQLIGALNDSGLKPSLHSQRILVRGSYAWEEFIEHAPCASAGEVERFYVRMGMLIRLLQLLEGRDFWLDNLIAHGEHPVFIDLETLLQPRLAQPGLLPSELEARRRLAESAVETCAIVMATPIGVAIGTEDLGALAKPRTFLSPFKLRQSSTARPGASPPPEQDFITWTHPEHAPMRNGAPADAADYLDEVLAGYRAMQECLQVNRQALLAPDGPLGQLRTAPVRYIRRDTWTCLNLLRQSVVPPLLADPVRREIFLQQLYRPILTNETDSPSTERHCKIIKSEVSALRELDVPLFNSLPNSRSAFTTEDVEIPGYFDDTAWNRLHDRLLHLDSFPLQPQQDLLLSCFATGHRTVPDPPSRRLGATGVIRASATNGRDRWIERAIEIGDAVLADAVTGPEDDLSWLGLVYHPHIDRLTLEPLQADLLTGSCGVAIFLADLYAATRENRWKTGAKGALAATLQAVNAAPLVWRDLQRTDRPRSIPLSCGAFLGSGAHIYCLCYCARLLADPLLERAASSCVAGLPVKALLEHAGTDVISGVAGLLLSVAAFTTGSDGVHTRDVAGELVSSLKHASVDAEGRILSRGYPRQTLRLDGLLDATDGLAVSLARLLQRQVGRSSCQLHDMLNTLGSVVLGRSGLSLYPGRLLGKLGVARLADSLLESAIEPIEIYLSAEPAEGDTAAFIDAMDVAITTFRTVGELKYHDRAVDFAKRVVTTRDSSGSWFPLSCCADRHNLSTIWGAPAIGRALLGLAMPATWNSVRLLELPTPSREG